MAKRNKNPNIINIEELEIENKFEIDYDRLAAAIVKAQKIEKENEEQAKEAALRKWEKEIGYNDHADKLGLSRKVLCFLNRFKVVWNIMFISKKKHIVTSPTGAFIQGLTASFFRVVQKLLVLLSISFVAIVVYHPNVEFGMLEYFMCGSFAILSFMLSRLFRLMTIEIEQMSNQEQVLGVFTAVVSVIPLIEKIAELLKGV